MIILLKNKGITIIEVLIVISIIGILSAIIIPDLTNFKKHQILRNTTEDVVSLLNTARNNTISSLNSTNYGIHFENDHIVYFAGSTLNDNDAGNETIAFDPKVIIPISGGINLNGGGNDVVFNRLTGGTENYGTIIIRLSSDSTHQKIITISKTGAISSN